MAISIPASEARVAPIFKSECPRTVRVGCEFGLALAPHSQAAAPVCELGSNPNNMTALVRALEDAGGIMECTRRVSAAQLAPTQDEVVKQFQSDSSRTDSPVRVLPPQPGSQVSAAQNVWRGVTASAAR